MTFTGHGHHIPGTVKGDRSRVRIHKCGGIGICNQCTKEADFYTRAVSFVKNNHQKHVDMEENGVVKDFQDDAKNAVVNYFNNTRVTQKELTENDVFVVWFSKTLQNWKALVGTQLPDGRYYELTYSGDKRELYLKVYRLIDDVILYSIPPTYSSERV